MKRLIILVLLISLAIPLVAKDKTYRIMEFTVIGCAWADTISTRLVLKNPKFRETNPRMRWFVENDFKAIAITIAESAVWYGGFELLRKYNKTLGYILMGGIILVRGYIIYRNFRNL